MDSAAISHPRPSLAFSGKLRAWVVLGRVSNLPTVWSNCLVGCWLGGWNSLDAVALLCLGGTLLYTGGMFLNDACDTDFDAEFRPERPIISGAISRRSAIIAGAGFLVVGVGLIAGINGRAGLLATGLAILIVVYDWTHKQIRTGPLLMGGCRFLLFLTAAAAGVAGVNAHPALCAAALGFYVAGLSYLARSESRPASVMPVLWLPLFTPMVIGFAFEPSFATAIRSLPLLLCIGWAMIAGRDGIGRAVGLLLAGIVLVDLIALSTNSLPMIAACLVWFGVTLLSQKYIPAT